jgi:putative nucleotidyltransferase with HDIG domain
MAIDAGKSHESLQRAHLDLELAYDTTIEGWGAALELRDRETAHHTLRVADMTIALAQAAGMTEAELVHVRRGALLHDIGKMAIPDTILLKSEKLTGEELEVMKQHPVHAYELLSRIAYLRPALDIPYCHHERWDGQGYPRGLKGEAIPLAARLFAVVDVWDAIRSRRPYRESWSDERALEHLRSLAGTHLDPHAVDLFMRVMDFKPRSPRESFRSKTDL